MDLARALSPTQHEAATHLDGPLCILAGAGSGKTRVITHRIAYLIEEKRALPSSILAVTFTNKAAEEMRHRIEALVPGRARGVLVGTFHGMAARFLRQYGDAVGVPRSFVIYDTDDSERLMKRIVIDELGLTKDLVRPFLWRIDGWQSDGLHPHEIPATPWNNTDEQARQVYARYVERLSAMNAVDFGGLLVKMRTLLGTPAGEELKRRVRHVLVDEYQDTNQVQADIVRAFAAKAQTIAVVGDDDQAIYGWRGASADNLKRFLDDLPGARLVRLEENYRSTRTILEAANGVIENNEIRLGKRLRATGDEGRRIRLLSASDDIDEAKKVVLDILDQCRVGRSLDEVAVLYRTNAVSRLFEDELRKVRLPYRLIGGQRFYDRKEVKDVLATVRAALNPRSDVDTLRMIAAVPRGIGETSLLRISDLAAARGVSILDVMCDEALLEASGLKATTKKRAHALAMSIVDLGRMAKEGLSAKDALALAVLRSGVAERLEAESTIESEGRLENVSALVDAAAQHDEDMKGRGEQSDVFTFLESAALLAGDENDRKVDENTAKITLMTLHSAKGLEFEVVYLVGLEEHGFPHSRAINPDASPDDLEEERRLAYVGITRAKLRLVLAWAKRRMVQGTPKMRTPSRFLREIPPDVLEGTPLPPPSQRDFDALPRSFGGPRLEFDDDVPLLSGDVPLRSGDVPRSGGRLPAARAPVRDENIDEVAPARTFPGVDRLAAIRDRLAHAHALSSTLRKPAVEDSAVGGEPSVVYDDDTAPPSARARSMPRDTSPDVGAGARVHHEVFGAGSVVGLRGAGKNQSALVRFDGERAPRVIILRHLSRMDDDGDVRVVLDHVEGEGREP
jgi:DNA helicase-2/ATP-dependent DNA helicase PcrA